MLRSFYIDPSANGSIGINQYIGRNPICMKNLVHNRINAQCCIIKKSSSDFVLFCWLREIHFLIYFPPTKCSRRLRNNNGPVYYYVASRYSRDCII